MKKIFIGCVIILCVLTVLLLITTVSNRLLLAHDKAAVSPYGQKVLIDGKQMNVSVQGQGEKTIVLLTGFGTGAPVLDFTPLTQRLSQHYRTVVIEPFGYGLSDLPDRERSVENITAELHQCLEALNIRRYILMPHSISGVYSTFYINRYPDEVEGLAGIDSSFPRQIEYTDMSSGLAMQNLLFDSGLARVATKLFPGFLISPDGDPAYTPALRRQLRLLTLVNIRNTKNEQTQMESNFKKAIPLSLPNDLPVLFFLSQDTINSAGFWVEGHEKQLETVKNGKILPLDGAHYLHHTHAQEIAQAVFTFFGV